MPVAPLPITPAQFVALEANITAQAEQMDTIATIAQSGLQYVTLLDVTQPELDLLTPFYNHLLNIESSTSLALFVNVALSLNNHIIQRATSSTLGDSSARMNWYLSDEGIKVSQLYASISSGGGIIIDSGNIQP